MILLSFIVANYDAIVPPRRYRENNGAVVQFVSDHELAKVCGREAVACVKTVGMASVVYVLNPCRVLRRDEYSTILCHELGHVNGWTHPTGEVISTWRK